MQLATLHTSAMEPSAMKSSEMKSSEMKTADKITTIRIILAPVFFAVLNLKFLNYWQIPVLWIIFIVAELTDMFDGMAARKKGEVSDFGKLYDPFADTLFQITIFFSFVMHNILPVIPFLLILYREFAILFIRNIMLRKGISMGARIGGKIKTVVYIIAAVLALIVYSLQRLAPCFADAGLSEVYNLIYPIMSRSAVYIFILAVILSLLSFADYVKVYRKTNNPD